MRLLWDTIDNIDVLLTDANPKVFVLHCRACHWWAIQDVLGSTGDEDLDFESEVSTGMTFHATLCASEPITEDC